MCHNNIEARITDTMFTAKINVWEKSPSRSALKCFYQLQPTKLSLIERGNGRQRAWLTASAVFTRLPERLRRRLTAGEMLFPVVSGKGRCPWAELLCFAKAGIGIARAEDAANDLELR